MNTADIASARIWLDGLTSMTKEEILKKHKQYLFPSISNYYSDPLVTDHASMQYVWDTEGKKYLDFFGGIVTVSVGHCNPRITAKIKAQIDKLQHASTMFPNEGIVALAEKLAEIAPGEISQSFISNSGTEANEMAIQIARMFTRNFEWWRCATATADAPRLASHSRPTAPGGNHCPCRPPALYTRSILIVIAVRWARPTRVAKWHAPKTWKP